LIVYRFLFVALSAAALQAQSPFIYYRGVVNVSRPEASRKALNSRSSAQPL
jgi:hypothetical protein